MKPRFHEEDDLDFNPDDFDTTPISKFDFEDEFEPAETPEPAYGSDSEAELKDLQARLRNLPKGHPAKKELAIRILDLHKKLSAEDTGYSSRRDAAAQRAQRAHLKKQRWMDSIVDDEPSYDGFESRQVLKCSDFILLESRANDFKTKSKKYFGWAPDPEAAVAAFIKKAASKEPKNL
jgi:hypothetical protein